MRETSTDLLARDLSAPISAPLAAADVAAVQGLSYERPLVTFGSAPFPDEPWWRRISPSSIFALLTGALAVLFLLQELLIAERPGFPVDNAWTHLVYAKNFFTSIAFEFNAGEHTSGPTSPFWTVFVAVGYAIFRDPILASKLTGSIFLFLAGYYSYRLLRTLRFDTASALMGGALVILTPRLAWAQLAGVECTLSAAIVIGSLWWYNMYHRGWRRWMTGVLFALAVITRPEASLVFALLLVHGFYEYLRSHVLRGRYWRDTIGMCAAFLMVLVPVASTNYALSGSIIPLTFRAGMAAESLPAILMSADFGLLAERLVTSVSAVWHAVAGYYLQDNPLLFIVIVAAAFIRRRTLLSREDPSRRMLRFGIWTLLLFPYLRALFLGVDTDLGEHARWVHFLTPIYVITGVAAFRHLMLEVVARGPDKRSLMLMLTGVFALVGAIVFLAGNALYLPVNHPWSMQILPGLAHAVATPPGATLRFINVYVFLVTLALSAFLAVRYARVVLLKPQSRREAVYDNAELEGVTYEEVHDEDEIDPFLPRSTERMLRAALLMTFAWNLAAMPRAFTEFGYEVKAMNGLLTRSADLIQQHTAPDDVIATNGIGTVGWATDRRVLDTDGILSADVAVVRRRLGADRAVVEAFRMHRPQYFAAFGTEYDALIARGLRDGFLTPVEAADNSGQPTVTLYRINTNRLPIFEDK